MPSSQVDLRWTGEGLHFEGGAPGRPHIELDGDSKGAPSPVDTLLLSLGACMGADVVDILNKSRVPLQTLEVTVEVERAETPPRRLTSVRIVIRVAGPAASQWGKVERAVALSRETYCSVVHSLRTDLDMVIEIEAA